MDTGRLRTKTELKRFVAENIKRKGITDDMLSIMIDVLWRDPANLRTSGFYLPGGTDAIIDFDTPTRTFSIKPFDPLVENFIPRFGFFSWSYRAVYHRIFKEETIQIPNEEGLFAFYFGIAETTRLQELKFIKNPTEKEIKKLYEKETIISFLYWRSDIQQVLAFGNDRHGSEWNPQHQYFNNLSFHAQRHSGMNVVGMEINEDGSLNSHAQFGISEGKMWHDDFILDIPQILPGATIPILFYSNGVPRFTSQSNFGVYLSGSRLGYNTSGGIATVDNENFICYHIFATNEHKTENQKVITAMGTAQYTTLGAAYYGIETELTFIYDYSPYKGMCLLGTVILEVDDTYTNSVHARIVGFSGGSHPPVTIAEDSKDYLEIDEYQELSFNPDMLQGDPYHDIVFEFRDLITGIAQVWILDIKASFQYIIQSAVLQTDDGTLTGIDVKIDDVAITGLAALTVETTISDNTATALNAVAITNQITIHTTTGYTGTPTLIRGKLRIKRT